MKHSYGHQNIAPMVKGGLAVSTASLLANMPMVGWGPQEHSAPWALFFVSPVCFGFVLSGVFLPPHTRFW